MIETPVDNPAAFTPRRVASLSVTPLSSSALLPQSRVLRPRALTMGHLMPCATLRGDLGAVGPCWLPAQGSAALGAVGVFSVLRAAVGLGSAPRHQVRHQKLSALWLSPSSPLWAQKFIGGDSLGLQALS